MKKTTLLVLFICFLAYHRTHAQTTVNSLEELVPYLNVDNANVKVAPGTYTITANDISDGTFGFLVPGELASTQYTVFLFDGNNSTYDFSGVTINFKTEVLSSFGSNDAREIQIIGNNNVLLNLTMVDDGSVNDKPGRRATNIVIDGANNRVEGFHTTVKGSYPYGYGDIFGKGGGSTIGHSKHSACLIRGNSNHLKNCTFIHKSYGHGIFMQAANDAIIEGCHVEGVLRTIAEVLAEEGTGSPADNVDFLTVWGYDLRDLNNNYRFSLQEDGIRAYNGGSTIIDGIEYSRTVTNATVIDNTIINMRSGVTLGLGKGTMYVENCTALGCESGFWGNNNATFVNCKGDASVGPLYSEDAERSGVTAELTLLDNHINKIGNTPSMYIAGSNHNFTLHDGTTTFNNEIEILISGKRYAHRWLEGSGEEPPNRNATNITFNNYTNYPIVLGGYASTNTLNSCGPTTDNGTNNTVNFSPTCEFPTCQKTAALIEAECFDSMSGIEIEDTHIGYIQDGDWVAYTDIDLTNMTLATARASSKGSGGNIELRLDSTTGTLIGTIVIPITGNWNSWVTEEVNITSVTGTHDIYTVFTGASGYLFNLDWLAFENTLSVNDLSLSQIKFYPNPATNSVTFKNVVDTTIEVYNIQGVLQLKAKISSHEKVISLENLSSGVYFFKFKTDQGTVVKKLIKK